VWLVVSPAAKPVGRFDTVTLTRGDGVLYPKRSGFWGSLLLAAAATLMARWSVAEDGARVVPPDPLVPARSSQPALPPSGIVAHVTVRVPEHAELWFEGKRTMTTGPVRHFVSPPLAPGDDYVYTVRARWKEGDREVTQTRFVAIHAGDWVNVSFPLPTGLPLGMRARPKEQR
jgi:uncharacterized protein (TIGR03000 family)